MFPQPYVILGNCTLCSFLLILSLVQGNFLLSCVDEYSTATPQVPVQFGLYVASPPLDILPHKFLPAFASLNSDYFFSIHHVTGLCLNSPFLCHSLTTSRAVNQGSCRAHLLLSLLSRIVGFLPCCPVSLKMYSFFHVSVCWWGGVLRLGVFIGCKYCCCIFNCKAAKIVHSFSFFPMYSLGSQMSPQFYNHLFFFFFFIAVKFHSHLY